MMMEYSNRCDYFVKPEIMNKSSGTDEKLLNLSFSNYSHFILTCPRFHESFANLKTYKQIKYSYSWPAWERNRQTSMILSIHNVRKLVDFTLRCDKVCE